MVFRVNVSNVDQEEVSLEVFEDDTLVKQLKKKYSSLQALYGLVTKWYHKPLPKIPTPKGWFAPSLPEIQKTLQGFFDAVVKVAGSDSFPVRSFFRLYDLQGKVVIVTGSSSGIGKQNAYQLAEMGAHVILACRTEAKTLPIVADIKSKTGNPNVEYMNLDLASLPNVRNFVEAFKNKNLPLHILINNAAQIAEGITDYGVDLTFGVCHVGPFLLTMSLLDILKRTENSRVVFVASEAARGARGLPWARIRSKIPFGATNPMEAYQYSKFANVVCTKELAKHLAEGNHAVTAYSLHPGVVATDIWRQVPDSIASLIKRFMLNEEEGSLMTLYCAVGEGCAKESGHFYDYEKGAIPEALLYPKKWRANPEDPALWKNCWEESEKMCGLASV